MNVYPYAQKTKDFAEELWEEGKELARVTVATVYRRTINYLRLRKRAYQLVFQGEAGKLVLADLAEFCRAEQSCFDADPRLHAVAEGRREVWLRICAHLNRNPVELNQMFGGPKLTGEYA